MKKESFLMGALFSLGILLIIGAAALPDISITRMIPAPVNLGATTNVDGQTGFVFYRSTTNVVIPFQLTNLISGASYEIQLFNVGGTAANVTLTGATGTTLSTANVTGAQSLTFGVPTANSCLRILITCNGNTNRVDFMDNYK